MDVKDMNVKVLWESKGMLDSLDTKARIVEFKGEYTMEIISRNDSSFWGRLVSGIKYIFKGSDIVLTIVPLDRKDIDKLEDIGGEGC